MEFVYCIADYDDGRPIAAFRTDGEREEWMTRQLDGLKLKVRIGYKDPSAPPPIGTVTTSAFWLELGPPRPPKPPYWYVTADRASIYKEFPTEKEAKKYRKKVLRGEVVPLIEFLPYRKLDIPMWEASTMPDDDDWYDR